jgi:hypothetical protein
MGEGCVGLLVGGMDGKKSTMLMAAKDAADPATAAVPRHNSSPPQPSRRTYVWQASVGVKVNMEQAPQDGSSPSSLFATTLPLALTSVSHVSPSHVVPGMLEQVDTVKDTPGQA